MDAQEHLQTANCTILNLPPEILVRIIETAFLDLHITSEIHTSQNSLTILHPVASQDVDSAHQLLLVNHIFHDVVQRVYNHKVRLDILLPYGFKREVPPVINSVLLSQIRFLGVKISTWVDGGGMAWSFPLAYMPELKSLTVWHGDDDTPQKLPLGINAIKELGSDICSIELKRSIGLQIAEKLLDEFARGSANGLNTVWLGRLLGADWNKARQNMLPAQTARTFNLQWCQCVDVWPEKPWTEWCVKPTGCLVNWDNAMLVEDTHEPYGLTEVCKGLVEENQSKQTKKG